MSLAVLANHMATKGRHGDDMLVHMSKDEVAALQRLAEQHGLTLTINPETGLPEAFSLKSLLGVVAPIALNFLFPGAGAAIGSALGIGEVAGGALLAGGVGALATGSLEKGLMTGLMAYGMGSLGGTAQGAGIKGITPEQLNTAVLSPEQTMSMRPDELARETFRSKYELPVSEGVSQAAPTPMPTATEPAMAVAPPTTPMPEYYKGITAETPLSQQPFAPTAGKVFADLPLEEKMAAIKRGDPNFLKNNARNLAMVGLPALAMLGSQNTLKGMTTETDPSKVRFSRFAFDPQTRTMVRVPGFSLAEYRAGTASPVGSFSAADGGIVALADGGTTPSYLRTSMAPGMLDFAERSEPVVRMADGGATREDVLNAYRNTAGAVVNPDESAINYWMGAGLGGFQNAVSGARAGMTQAQTSAIDQQRASAGLLGGTLRPVDGTGTTLPTATGTLPTLTNNLDSAFVRQGDASGLGKTDTGAAPPDLMKTMGAAGAGTQTVAAQPTQANLDTITNIYRNVLGRDPDAVGLNYWAGRLAGGESIDSVLAALKGSAQTVLGANAATLAPGLSKTVAQATATPTGYVSSQGNTIGDEWIRNTLGREPNAADMQQPWYQALNKLNAGTDVTAAYSAFQQWAQREKAGVATPASWFEASQLSKPKTATTGPVIQPPGTQPPGTGSVIPGAGTVPTMQQVVDAYTKGGGSLGYIPYAPKTEAEMEARYPLSGVSKDAYDYLMGKAGAKYPVVQKPAGGISQAYWKAAGMEAPKYGTKKPDSGGDTTIDTSNINPNAPARMQADYDAYWKNNPVGSEIEWAGGKLKRTGKEEATFTSADGKTVALSPRSRFIDLANAHPDILKLWKQTYGYDPERDKPVNPPEQGGGVKAGGLMSLKRYAEGGATDSPTAEDYARAQIQQELNRAGTAEEIANRASQITVDPNKGYATEVFYDPLGQRIERPVFMTGPSTAQVTTATQFPGAAEEQNIPYIERSAGQVLGKDNNLYSMMEHGELLRQTLDPARLAYMQDQAAKDAAGLGPYVRDQFSAGPVNYQLQDAIAQAKQLSSAQPSALGDPRIALAKQIVQLGYDPTGKYEPEIMQIVQQLKGTRMAGGGRIPLGILAAAAEGGQFDLGGYSDGGRLLKGPGDGVSDSIPATIGGKRPARLADGEFVVPARIVSELGNGSTDAGARKLYAMMDRIQANRSKTTGKGKVAVNSRADKYLPA